MVVGRDFWVERRFFFQIETVDFDSVKEIRKLI